MQKSVSIKDIAKAAGVSPSTVSRALHGHPRISEATIARVRHLAQEMGYTPSMPARSLVTQDTATIGLIITQASDPFLGHLVLGVEEEAQGCGYSVFLVSSYRDADREREIVYSLHERRVTGVVVTGSEIDAGYLELAERYPMPIVLVNCPTYPYSVSTDNQAGARQAMEHLLQNGHRRVAYVANRRSYDTDLDRLASYRAVLTEHEISIDKELIVSGDGSLDGGVKAMEQLLALSRRPTAVFCFNDMTAIGAIYALTRAGLHVPDDCSVIGYDDLELAAYYCPPLTTVRQYSYRLGQRAMHMLSALIQGRGDVQAEVLPAKLVVRQTTGPAPAPAQVELRR